MSKVLSINDYLGFWSPNFQMESNKKKHKQERPKAPFSVMVRKEIADHIKSPRVVILISIIFLTCVGSLYTALSNLDKLASGEESFCFLKFFTVSDGTLPSFFVFVGFLGPLMGISLGFDAVNSEQNRGTLSRILSQPIPRDYIINTKFVASIAVIAVMFFTLSFLVLGVGLIAIGIPPTAQEFLRIVFYTLLSIIYVSFWLNLSILFSVRFKQPATSALTSISVWLFFTVFYPLIVNIITKGFQPSQHAPQQAQYFYNNLKFMLSQLMPNQLFSEATSTLLMPSMRSIGPLAMEQLDGAIPSVLPLGQSLLLAWPQLTGIVALTLICFLISYLFFMRREVRSK